MKHKIKTIKKVFAYLLALSMVFQTPAIMALAEESETGASIKQQEQAEAASDESAKNESKSETKETPTEAPTEAPVSAPTEAPTEAPVSAPTEAPAEVPAEASTEVPAEAPTEAPAETPVSEETEITADTEPETSAENGQGESDVPSETLPEETEELMTENLLESESELYTENLETELFTEFETETLLEQEFNAALFAEELPMAALNTVVQTMYVTLLDAEGAIIATSNPDKEALAGKYRPVEDGGEGATVDIGAAVYVYMEMPVITDASSDDGVQDDVIYYLGLPSALVPEASQLVNGDNEPIQLNTTGQVKAWAGVFNENSAYQFRMQFKDTAEQLNISATYQYTATVSDSLEPGETAEVPFGSFATLTFPVTPEEPETEPPVYKLSAEGHWKKDPDTNPNADWTVTIEDCSQEPSIQASLDISLDGGMGIVANTSKISAGTPLVSLSGDEKELALAGSTVDTSGLTIQQRYSAGQDADGKEQYVYLNGSIASDNISADRSNFIITGITLTFGESGNPVTGVEKWTVSLSGRVYAVPDGANEKTYTLKAVLQNAGDLTNTDTADDDLQAVASIRQTYKLPSVKHYVQGNVDASGNITNTMASGALPKKLSYCTVISNKCGSNYVDITDNPNYQNTAGAYYFLNGMGFYGSNNLENTLAHIYIDNQEISWTSLTVMPVQYIGRAEYGGDVVAARQVQAVVGSSGTWLYKSTQTNAEGFYYWLVVAPETSSTEQSNLKNGYNMYADIAAGDSSGMGTATKVTPASWRIYIFNTLGSEIELRYTQELGSYTGSSSQNSNSIILNQVSVNNGSCGGANASPIAAYRVTTQTQPMTKTGTLLENGLIKWELEVDLSGVLNEDILNNLSSRTYYYRIYDVVSSEQQILMPGSSAPIQVDGQNGILPYYMYSFANGQWEYGKAGPPFATSPNSGDNITNLSPAGGTLYYWYGNYSSYITNGKLRLMYFTKIADGASANLNLYSNTAELLISAHDLYYGTGANGNTYNCLTVQASGAVPRATLSKTVSAASDEDAEQRAAKMTRHDWTLTSGTFASGGSGPFKQTYFLNGYWSVSDKISGEIKDASGERIADGNPGTYMTLDSMTIQINTGTGDSAAVTLSREDMEAEDLNGKLSGIRFADGTAANGTLTYTGNMADGFVLALDGLKNCAQVTVNYSTVFDEAAFVAAMAEKGYSSHKYSVTLKNGASTATWGQNTAQASAQASGEVLVSLEIEKQIDGVPDISTWDSYSRTYRVITTTGYSAVPYVDVKDAVSEYYEFENLLDANGNLLTDTDGNAQKEEISGSRHTDPAALQALASSLNLSDISITLMLSGESQGEVIYKDGAFVDGWKASSFTLSQNHESGQLFDVRYERDDAKAILPGSVFTIRYKATLDMEHTLADGTAFRASEFYKGHRLDIKNDVSAAVIAPSAAVSEQETIRTRSAAQQEGMLVVTGSARGDYLKSTTIKKEIVEQEGSTYRWKVTMTLGTKGKDASYTLEMADELQYTINEGVDSETEQKLLALLEKYSVYSNIKIYKNDTGTPAFSYAGVLTGKESAEADSGMITAEPVSENGRIKLSWDELPYGTSVILTYDTDIDWVQLLDEAKEEELLNEQYKVLAGEEYQTLTYTVENKASLEDVSESSQGSRVEVRDDILQKTLQSQDAETGSAAWQITAMTGSECGSSIVLEDCVTVTAGEAVAEEQQSAIKAAAEAATSIDKIKITLAGTVIYDNTEEEPYSEGWTEENLKVTVNQDNLTLRIELLNTDQKTAIRKYQTVVADYTTVLDYDKFIQNGGRTGAAYNLSNSVTMSNGSKSTQDDADSDEFQPDIPVKLEKSFRGNDEGSLLTTKWSVTAGSGAAARQEFIITDEITCGETVKKCLSLTDMVITREIVDGEGEKQSETIFNYGEDQTELPEGVHLYKKSEDNAETEDFIFGENGSCGFILAFDELEKDAVIRIDYSAAIDRVAYLKLEGVTNESLALTNAAHVGTKDGSQADQQASGSASVSSKLTKEGQITGTDPESGNPILEWTMDVNLLSDNTKAQLKNAEVFVTDHLDASLKYLEDSVKVYARTTTPEASTAGEALSSDQFLVTTEGNSVKIQILNPEINSDVRIVFRTECTATLNSLDNTASVSVNGITATAASEPVENIIAVVESGTVVSMDIPEFTPEAYKYLDQELTDVEFRFRAVETDENGEVLENGYESTASNDENGKVTFDKIRYRDAGERAVHYYKIYELTDDLDTETYIADPTEFLVKVEIVRGKTAYNVSGSVIAPEHYERAEFSNTTVPAPTTCSFTVRKEWSGEKEESVRPASVTVYLLRDGERYNNMSVTLSEANDWTYTWEELPINGEYSVEEAPVESYTAAVHISEEGIAVITNTWQEKQSENEPQPGTEKPGETQPETEKQTGSEPQPETEKQTGSETQPETEEQTGSETQPETEEQTETVTASVRVIKELIYEKESLYAKDASFYVALFEDAARMKRVSEVKTLALQNASSSGVIFDGLTPGAVYYVGETDETGNVLLSGLTGDDVVFTPLYQADGQVIPIAGNVIEYTFQNEFLEIPYNYYVDHEAEEETEEETKLTGESDIEQEDETETASDERQTEAGKSVKTGDDTPIGGYLLLAVLAVFFIAAGFVFRRRRLQKK